MRIPITQSISIGEDELAFAFIRSPGPGGQNVNKVSSAAQLRFDLRHSPSLPEPMKRRAAALAGQKLTLEGVIVITASRFRVQAQNRDDAIERLVALLRDAAVPPKPRVPTRPSRAARRKRLDTKARRGETKRGRSGGIPEE